jgi:hypothetical protein
MRKLNISLNVKSVCSHHLRGRRVHRQYMRSNAVLTVPKRIKSRRSTEKNDIDTELLKTLKKLDNRTEDACELRKVQNTEAKQRR